MEKGGILMKRKNFQIFMILLFAYTGLFLFGCWETGELSEESLTIHVGEAEQVHVVTAVYKGNLSFYGSEQQPLLITKISSNLNHWFPKLTYDIRNGEGYLKIIQEENEEKKLPTVVNDLFLSFNESIPLDFDLLTGSGDNHLDFSRIFLTGLNIAIGTGDTLIDLTGDYPDDLTVNLVGGIGHTKVFLPAEVGTRILFQGILNRISCDGFYNIGNLYYNSSYHKSERRIYMNIISGLGFLEIELI